VYAIDLLGFGASDKPPGFQYTMETWAQVFISWGFNWRSNLQRSQFLGEIFGIQHYKLNLYPVFTLNSWSWISWMKLFRSQQYW